MPITYTWFGAREPVSNIYNRTVTHGDQLTVTDVGPWALQAVPKGTETLQNMTVPGRGYWRFDTATEFTTDTAWPSNANDSNPSILNDTTLHEGKVTGSPVTIDGFSVPVGTYICQFRNFSATEDGFYAQGTSLPILFRGCRWRFTAGLGGQGLFNDNTATSSQHIYMHYCDFGMTAADMLATAAGLVHIKLLGGLNHRMHRNYSTFSSTFYQPNTQGCVLSENYIDNYVFAYGEKGPSGVGPDSTTYHNNGISCEGGITSITIIRNHIICPSPDGAIGSNGFTAAGQTGYGTQSGQVGYGSGTNPGRIINQTDCIALFSSNSLPNQGTSPGSILIQGNYLGGAGVTTYLGNALGNCTNIHVYDNKWTTKYWTNSGAFGAATDVPIWGTNGNDQSNNTWADDYGTGGDGTTTLANRQYPSGNGPRAGTSVL
jgi:hypothetical protein